MRLALSFLLLAALTGFLFSQATPEGSIERIKVHGKSLEGNLIGDSPDREVSIYLPPSYKTARNRRYPVLYMLHGFTDSDDLWFGLTQRTHWINYPKVLNQALAVNGTREMIVVMPNGMNTFGGCMYSSSVTIGDWETFLAKELVSYVDSHYRTLAQWESRGLSGHSMGGYGAARIGMKYPDVFSSVYLMSPCCMSANITPPGQGRGGPSAAESVKTKEDVAKAAFGTKAQLASAAAWSPNPKNPPFYFDLTSKDGQFQPAIAAKWAANAPLAMVDQYMANLKKLKAIAFDAGTQDRGIAATIKVLDQILTDNGVPHTYETYEGNHTNHVADRIVAKQMPFFSQNLAFERRKR